MIWHLSDWFHFQRRLLVFIFMNLQEVSLHYPEASHRNLLWAQLFSPVTSLYKNPCARFWCRWFTHFHSRTDCAVLSCSCCWFGHCLTVVTCLRCHALSDVQIWEDSEKSFSVPNDWNSGKTKRSHICIKLQSTPTCLCDVSDPFKPGRNFVS